MKILSIESSCDETAAAVIEDGRKICSSVIHTQVEEHKLYGGVVPEIASRRHIESICGVTAEALEQAGLTAREVDAVAVTAAPGLIGAVLVGVNFAKGLALSAEKPLIPVHHIRGHVAANYLAHPELEPPFLALIVSGGHSHIVRVQDYTHFEVLGRTVDDAAGEAFDKVARTLGAGCTTTCLDGSRSAAHTLAVSSFSWRAPVGQATMHWPQLTQPTSPSFWSKAGSIRVLKPRPTVPMTPIFCTLPQAAMQRRHWMHLFGSRSTAGDELSIS